MRVLVTGATSRLGRGVVAGLLARGDDVTVLQRGPAEIDGVTEVRADLGDNSAVRKAVAGAEGVIHLAAKVGISGPHNDFVRINVAGTQSLLIAAHAAGVTNFVQVSSPSVAHAGSALVGVGAQPADPEGARGSYARTKASAELAALAANAPGFAVVAIRPHLVWGPGDAQLVGRIVERAETGRLALVGAGTALIDTTYVDNAATALMAALDRAPAIGGRAFVVSNGEPRPVAELVERICAAAGVPAPVRHVPRRLATTIGGGVATAWSWSRRTDEPPLTRFLAEQLGTAHWFDQRETRRELEWAPHVSLDEGFRRLAESYRVKNA